MGLRIGEKFFSKYKLLISSFVVALAIVAQPYVQVLPVFAVAPISITNSAELASAITNQQDGQIWSISPGDYALTPNNTITAGGQTGWIMPITADNVTINGIGNPTIYGNQYRTNGIWATQDLVAVFGDNVTINGVTLMPSTDNKTLEVIGRDFTFTNSVIAPNTKMAASAYDVIADPVDRAFAQQWGGSLYFNGAGNHVITNVTINNAGISYRFTPADTHITFNNVNVVHATNIDDINTYRYSSGFDAVGNTVTGAPVVTYHVSAALGNLASVIAAAQNGDIISIDSDLTLSKAIVLTKAVTINGNGRTITAPFAKTDTDNNAAFMVNANSVVINDLAIKGVTASTLHGINAYRVTGVSLNDITVESFRSGVVVNGSSVAIKDITTRNNAWNGINVDKTGAHLTISGNNAHTEAVAIYVDDTTTGAIVTDLENSYVSQHINADGVHPNDVAYTLKLPAPTGLSMTASPSNTLITNNGYTSSASVVAKWGAVTGAHHYKYKYWNDIATSPYKVSSPYITNVTGTSAPGVFNQGEGIHHFAVSVCNANNVCSPDSSVFSVTFDQTKPAGITNLSPANGSYETSANLASIDWSDTSDAIGPISYYYESSTSSSLNPDGSFTSPAYRSAALSSSNIPTAGTPAGVYYWHARAVDAAGNSTEWTTPWKVAVDNTAPTINLTSPADGTTIPGTSITQSWESASTDIDHYIYTSYNNAMATSVRYSQNIGTATSKTATNVANATYWWRVTAVDKAGNQTTSPLWKLTVSNPIPSVSAEDFGVAWTKPSRDFEGINVGFNIQDFSTVTGISVDLYKDDEKLITNNATSSLLGLFNNGTLGASLSTPFVTNGTFVDSFCGGGECWNRGIRSWVLADEPTKTVITVTGKNNIGQPTTKSATNSSFAQTVGTFRSILPKVTIPATPAVPATPATPNSGTTTPAAATPAARATPATPAATRVASVADATPATDTATDAAVLGATDIASTAAVDDPSINENAVLGVADTKHAGLAWYWWTAIAAAAVSIVWWIAGALRRKKQEY